MKKYSKTFNVNTIKLCSYYAKEISGMLGVTTGTVYAWKKEGLKPNDDTQPLMFHGSVLRKFLKERQDARTWKCAENEMPCFKCQRGRRPLEGKASLQPGKGRNPNITGKCSVCKSQMFKTVRPGNLPKIASFFKLVELQDLHLVEPSATTTNNNKIIGE